MKVKLSVKQRAIVEATDGAHLVLASAGSGKTRILTERIRYLLEHRTAHFKVLGLTFTNKAADEMRKRLGDIIDLADNAYIGTIHSFCQMVIESHGHTLGYQRPPVILERETDRLEVLEEVLRDNAALRIDDAARGDERKQRQSLYELLGWISRRKRALSGSTSDDEDRGGDEDAELVYRDYNARLAAQGAIDFDDILLLAYRILTELPQVGRLYARMYRHVCVDEAQDLNEAQYALIRLLAADHGNILMVGDPNQAIYGFNGSSRRFMLEDFPKDFRVTTRELRENYRAAKAVIRTANALFADSIDEVSAPLDGLCEIQALDHEEAEARWIADKIQELLELGEHPEIDGRISLDRIAVLARNRYVFLPFERKLKADGIPHYLKRAGAGDNLESDFARAFDLGLRLLANPLDRLHRGQLCRLLGVDGSRNDDSQPALGQLRAMATQIGPVWRQDYDELVSAWALLDGDANRFPNAVANLKQHCLRWIADDQERSTEQALAVQDLEYLAETWRNYAFQIQAERRTLGHFRNQMAIGLTTPQEEQDGLALATVHSVKGLEYDIVFLMGMVEGTFPDYRAVRAGGRALEEEKNEAFVAVTRARRFLFISWPRTKFMPWDQANRVLQRRSRFLSSIDAYTAEDHWQVLHVAEETSA